MVHILPCRVNICCPRMHSGPDNTFTIGHIPRSIVVNHTNLLAPLPKYEGSTTYLLFSWTTLSEIIMQVSTLQLDICQCSFSSHFLLFHDMYGRFNFYQQKERLDHFSCINKFWHSPLCFMRFTLLLETNSIVLNDWAFWGQVVWFRWIYLQLLPSAVYISTALILFINW